MATLWHGRFGSGPADELLAYTVSLSFDQRLARDDIVGSRAHVRMLGHVGLLDEAEVRDVIHALDVVEAELAGGSFSFDEPSGSGDFAGEWKCQTAGQSRRVSVRVMASSVTKRRHRCRDRRPPVLREAGPGSAGGRGI